MSEALAECTLSRDEARSLTDEVRADAERLWLKLVELYDGGAHLALDYPNWETYFRTEFGGTRSAAYQLLSAGQVMRQLAQSSIEDRPKTESVARELRPLKNDPEILTATWEKVLEEHPEPTAAQTREVVQSVIGMSRKAEMNADAAKRRVYDGLSSVSGYATALTDPNQCHRALSTATPDDIAAWDRLASESIRALSSLRRAIREAK